MAYAGDAIRIHGVFHNATGTLTDPSSGPKLTIYDDGRIPLVCETYPTATAVGLTKTATGTFYFDFQTPSTAHAIVYEWLGGIGGLDEVVRGRVRLVWVE